MSDFTMGFILGYTFVVLLISTILSLPAFIVFKQKHYWKIWLIVLLTGCLFGWPVAIVVEAGILIVYAINEISKQNMDGNKHAN